MSKKWITTTQAAEELDVSRMTIVREINRGNLEARRKSLADRSPWLVSVNSIEEAKEQRRK